MLCININIHPRFDSNVHCKESLVINALEPNTEFKFFYVSVPDDKRGSFRIYSGFQLNGVAHCFQGQTLIPLHAHLAQYCKKKFGSFTKEQTTELFRAFQSVYGPLVSLVEVDFDPNKTIEFLQRERDQKKLVRKAAEKLAQEAADEADEAAKLPEKQQKLELYRKTGSMFGEIENTGDTAQMYKKLIELSGTLQILFKPIEKKNETKIL